MRQALFTVLSLLLVISGIVTAQDATPTSAPDGTVRIPLVCEPEAWLTNYTEGNGAVATTNEVQVQWQETTVTAVSLSTKGVDDEAWENSHFPCNKTYLFNDIEDQQLSVKMVGGFSDDQSSDPDARAIEIGASLWTDDGRFECVLLFQMQALPYIEYDLWYHVGGEKGWRKDFIQPTTLTDSEWADWQNQAADMVDLLADGQLHEIEINCSIEDGQVIYNTLQIDDQQLQLYADPSPATEFDYAARFVTCAVQLDQRKDGREVNYNVVTCEIGLTPTAN